MTVVHHGRCFCGAVEFTATGEPVEAGFCHCGSCRSHAGGPMSAFTLWPDEAIVVTRGAEHLGGFNKAGTSDRRFCRLCGGHLMTRHPGFGFTDVRAGALPGVPFRPQLHLNYAEAVRPVRDGLPKLRDFPAHAGGSGELMAE